MKKLSFLFITTIFFVSNVLYAQQIDTAKIKAHPRLLLMDGEEKGILSQMKTNSSWNNYHLKILQECDAIISIVPVERTMIGRRLLQVSREALRRIFYLSYAFRMTGQEKYATRCEKEMLAVAAFADWNPAHFLDVAEMTMAVAIGYDWLFARLSPASKKTISDAIRQKGIATSLDPQYNGWLRSSNNWNQVCNAGISFGALAIYEDDPVVARQVIERALTSIRIPMKHYAPDGNYMEGYSYWGYGTSFNVFFIDAIEKIFGTDHGLSAQQGFLQTGLFYENLVSQSSGKPFNYSDCGGHEGLQPAMFWFAQKNKDASLLFQEKQYLQDQLFDVKTSRFLPAAVIWGKDLPLDKVVAPDKKIWIAKEDHQVAIMRTSWEKGKGIYAGFKGGSPATSHAHMDVGSFVLDIDGVRWSADLGMQQYNSLESAGLQIWDMSQASQRWKVFRYANYSHSTLTVNDQLQNVKGNGRLVKFSDDSLNRRAVMDISSAYEGQLKSVHRGLAILDGRTVTVRDEIETSAQQATIRWVMLTPASVEITKEGDAVLTNGKHKLKMQVTGIDKVKIKTWSTDPPKPYDATNKGTVLVGFEITVPAKSNIAFNVSLIPESNNGKFDATKLLPLAQW
ncbi:heparinase II/III-family protein [Terrimonas sp. NA20]|uniref:Heparinase II/III-family protein n=1 Tax=Terrimonas ginsenosidimutans TaxID=2908004 RepID=A0ABS9KSN6_9BACT|nr:heparinase II/III family protein [Terrimonas ginsenosidimutans]MCG2615310.1 heparinase II/III-family protein [Terrimonas ginsenosidimutans]